MPPEVSPQPGVQHSSPVTTAAPQGLSRGPSAYRALDPTTGLFTQSIGVGLFTTVPRRREDHLANFVGEQISAATARRRTASGHGGYMVALSKRLVLDCYRAAQQHLCWASCANTARGLRHLVSGAAAVHNACLRVHKSTEHGWTARLVATDSILAHTEVFFPYQAAYRLPLTGPDPDLATFPALETAVPSAVPSATPSVAPSAAPAAVPLAVPSSTVVAPPHAAASLPPVVLGILRHADRRRVDALPVLTSAARDAEVVRTTTAMANLCLSQLWDDTPVESAEVLSFLRAAHRVAAEACHIPAAVAWGANYQFPAALLARDCQLFLDCGSSIPAVARQRRAASLHRSFNITRVHAMFGFDGTRHPTFPVHDFRRLEHLARYGIQVPLPSRFRPCAEPAELRTRYIEVQCAIHRMYAAQAEPGTVLLLPLELVCAHPGIHLQNAQHWTTKKGKPQGRSIADLSNVGDPFRVCPINGHYPDERAALLVQCDELFGTIRHPTLPELMVMLLAVVDEHGWERVQLWKMDLQGAFNLLWFAPEATPLMAFVLTGGLVAIHFVGLFGWTGMPAAFHVLTRALEVLVRAAIVGRASFYVDDCMGCSPSARLAHDMAAAHSCITALAGDAAVATDKTESGRALEFIGWTVCLNTRRVSVSPRNLLKVAHAFFSCDPAHRVSGLHVERMASLASRISVLCRYMRPFTRRLPLEATRFPTNPRARHFLSNAARCEIAVWRAFVILLHCRSLRLSRPIGSFRPMAPSYAIRYDASLTSIAAGVFQVAAQEEQLLCYAVLPVPCDVHADSSYQNTFEYLAVLLGLLLLASEHQRDFTFAAFGDSMSSLAWLSADRVHSDRALRANLGMVTLAVHCNAHAVETTHVAGVLNVVFDGLSRALSPATVGLDPALQRHLPPGHPVAEFIALCDPTLELVAGEEYLLLMGSFATLLRDLPSTL
jgi:hypothetical protein